MLGFFFFSPVVDLVTAYRAYPNPADANTAVRMEKIQGCAALLAFFDLRITDIFAYIEFVSELLEYLLGLHNAHLQPE